MYVKICGITKLEQATEIAKMGISALGFICVPNTPRYVDPEQIQLITNMLPSQTDRVGVFLDASMAEISKIVQSTGLNCVQLHGSESPEFCRVFKSTIPNVKLIKALRIRSQEILAQVDDYCAWVDIILLDAYDPNLAGGTGKTINWEMLKDFQSSCPWWLAGGLSPDNVAIALQHLQPDGIDVSSGVEISPGNKDSDRVRQLLAAVQQVVGKIA
jgi:phosphoribosylanthranilate isomerase